ncbi:MAG: energy transducer TonB [Gammaproteobacteria bacterium]
MTSTDPRPLHSFLPWLLASVAVHAGLFLPWPQAGAPVTVAMDTADSAPLQVQLMKLAQPQPAQASAAQRARAAPVAAVPMPAPLPVAAATHVTTAPKHRAWRGGQPPTDNAYAATDARPASARMPAATLETRPTASNADSDGNADRDTVTAGWAELRALLHVAIDRHKRYPQSALSMGREGSARVDFRLRPDGHIDDLNIGVSSGVRALDLAAYHAVQAIAPFTAADRYLDSTQHFQVDVVFRIN